jgi:FtsP/CotA-like multicopper oxidase with cupredoxin domain
MDRRSFLEWGGVAASAAVLSGAARVTAQEVPATEVPTTEVPANGVLATEVPTTSRSPRARVSGTGGQPAVVTPDGTTLPLTERGRFKVGHLIAEELEHTFAPGLTARVWGYNGGTPGPTIEAVEGDWLRIYVTNRLPEPTTVHWHGLVLANGMDGVSGLNQAPIPPGETWAYELELRRAGTFMYHSHYDEMTQIALGMAGMLIVHPRRPVGPAVDRDFVLMTHEWKVEAGARRPDANAMNDFNLLTFNGKAYPGTSPLVVGVGERVRIRLGNLSPMDHHPIHIHGVRFVMTATDGGYVPASAQYPETTVLVPVGSTRVIELLAEEPGDWAMHCHMTHHVMTQMGHGLPPMIGADTSTVDRRMSRVMPAYMSMGATGMGGMGEMAMDVPPNSLPMRGAEGPFSYIDMGGMFTVLKVREDADAADPRGWYAHPPGTVPARATADALRTDGIELP